MAVDEARADALTGRECLGVPDGATVLAQHDGVAALERGQRADGAQGAGQGGGVRATLSESPQYCGLQPLQREAVALAQLLQLQPRMARGEAGGQLQ